MAETCLQNPLACQRRSSWGVGYAACYHHVPPSAILTGAEDHHTIFLAGKANEKKKLDVIKQHARPA